MPNLIACRVASYGKFQDQAWSHLQTLGVRNVEVPVPQPEESESLRRRLRDHRLTATSFQARCDIAQPEAAEVMRPQIEACRTFGVPICFLSAKAGDTDRELVWQRLRQIGDLAAAAGVIVALETHPDLITNGDEAGRTMAAVNHPNVKVNFDTANVYFYNEGVTATGELSKIADHVAAIHLKDTNGKYKDWHFPALGTGVVDFPAVFALMGNRRFTGPYTMELEGIKGVEMDEPTHLQYIADSVAYLRRIAAL